MWCGEALSVKRDLQDLDQFTAIISRDTQLDVNQRVIVRDNTVFVPSIPRYPNIADISHLKMDHQRMRTMTYSSVDVCP